MANTAQSPATPAPHDGRIRVLFVNNATFMGGAQWNIRHRIKVMDRDKFDPIVAIPEERLAWTPFFAETGATVVGIPLKQLTPFTWQSPLHLMRSITALVRLVREHRVDIIHAQMSRSGILIPPVKWLTGAKFVWHLCDGAFSDVVKRLTPLADRCTCVSRFVLNQFERRDESRFQLLYSGVWVDEGSPEELAERRREIRQELGIAADTPVVGVVANLQYWKGIHVAVQAMREVLRTHPTAVMVHVGGETPGYEAYAREVRQLVADLNVGDRIRLLGYRRDALRLYAAFDLYVHVPVFERGCTEAFGHSIVEAMAHRLAVVTSRGGGPEELVTDGITAELVDPDDAVGLARQILALLADPARRMAMGAAGYDRYRAFFTQDREEREYEQLYAQLLNRHDLVPSTAVVSSECIQ